MYRNHDPKHFREKLVFSAAIHLFLDWLPGFLNREGDSVLKFNANPGQPVIHFFRRWEGDRSLNFILKTTPPGAGLIHNMQKAVRDPLLAANEETIASGEARELNEIGCGIRRDDIDACEAFYDNDVTKVLPAFYRFSWFMKELFSNRIELGHLVNFKHHVDVVRYPDEKSDSSDSDSDEEWEDPEEIMTAIDNEADDDAVDRSNTEVATPDDNALSRNASNTSSVSTRTPSKGKANKSDGSKETKRRLTDRKKLDRTVDKALAMEKRKGNWLCSVINATTNIKSKAKVPTTVTQQHVLDILPFLFEKNAIKKISFDKDAVKALFQKGDKALEPLETIFRIRANYDEVMREGNEAQEKINKIYEEYGTDEEEEKDNGRTSPENNEEAKKEAASASPARKKLKTDAAAGVSVPDVSKTTPKQSVDPEPTERTESPKTCLLYTSPSPRD